MSQSMLSSYVAAVQSRVSDIVSDPRFHPSQRELLNARLDRMRGFSGGAGFAEPLGLLYLVVRAAGREPDEQVVEVSAFCFLYLAALDLFDDVQDDDLAGTPHEHAGSALAVNDALTFFVLAVSCLRRAAELEGDRSIAERYFRLFERISLAAVTGQHRDLLALAGPRTPAEVLSLHADKTSSVGLLVECGALLARCDEAKLAGYRRIGERLAPLVQIVDDLRDIYGKPTSPDLASGKLTYPVACLRESAAPATLERFRSLVAELPGSMDALRDLFHESGAVERCARTLDELRCDIHREVLALGTPGPAHRTFLGVIDLLVSTVYEPEPVPESAGLFRPRGGFHDAVRAELAAFLSRMAPFDPPEAPALEPWAEPQYLYESRRRVIYYPDLDGMREEILPFQAALLGIDDLDAAEAVMKAQLPSVLAHEFFHFWRHHAGRLSEDSWHEEFAANRLAVSYSARFCPDVLEQALRLRERVSAQLGHLFDETGERILARCHEPSSGPVGYEVDLPAMAVVQLELVSRLAAAPADLASDVARLLGANAPNVAPSVAPNVELCA
jgi:geranylgeranyl pyrophosphate synthase